MAIAVSAARRPATALAALVLGSIAIGASPIFVRLSELGPVATAFHRMLWALPLLYVWMRVERASLPEFGLDRRDMRSIALCGILFVGDLAFWHWSILRTSVANATLFANFSPIVVTVGAWAFLNERIKLRFLVGMILSLGGAALLVGSSLEFGAGHVVGDAYGLVTALFFGSYMVALAALRTRVPAATVMFYSSVVTCAGLFVASYLEGESVLPLTLEGLALLVGLAWVSQVAGQGLIAFALGHLPASFSALVILIEPLTAAVLGWVLLGEALGTLQFIGGAVVLAGILVARTRDDVAAA
ncbi:MAG TPA: DMT family transporter [Candidatus Cybelea sp.]|nr:DMT family transporter [Candidatus Cybelea sp.]